MGLKYGFIMIMCKILITNLNDNQQWVGIYLNCERLFVPIQLPLSFLPNLKDTKPEKDNFARNDGQIYVV